jgi:type VI secretion system protein VasJ
MTTPTTATATTLRARAAEEARPLLTPPLDGPCARPPVGDARYVRLREEIDRPQSVEGGVTDWREVASLGRALLSDGLGDLLIAAYTARAAQHTAGLAGTAFALALLDGRLPGECEGASPRRRRALASALRWWTRGAEGPLRRALEAERASITPADLEELRASLDEVAARTRGLLGERAPAFGELRRELDRALDDATRPPQAPHVPEAPPPAEGEAAEPAQPAARMNSVDTDPPAPEAAPTPTNAAPEPSAPVELTANQDTVAALAGAATDADLQRQLRRLGEQLLDAGDHLRRRDLRDPRAYALSREGLWLHLVAAPPARAGKSTIPPRNPSAQRRLESLAAEGAWPAFIDAGERLLRRSRLDLDLQRALAQALESLDPPATAAAAVIRQRTREFVARLPELLALCDRDGMPIASPETASWLRDADERPPRPAAPAVRPTAPQRAPSASPPVDDTPAAAGDAPQFTRRLVAAEAALNAGQRELAGLLFAGLDEQVERHGLRRWQPDLARRVLAGRVLTSDAEDRAAAAQRLGFLCPDALAAILDPR